jgi:small subunit ribosomal protein S17
LYDSQHELGFLTGRGEIEQMGERGKRKILTGVVASDKMEKTVVVAVNRLVLHPVYKKYIRKRTKVKAHDEKKECHVGDKVLLIETRPLSKDKRWRVKEILERAA